MIEEINILGEIVDNIVITPYKLYVYRKNNNLYYYISHDKYFNHKIAFYIINNNQIDMYHIITHVLFLPYLKLPYIMKDNMISADSKRYCFYNKNININLI